MIQYISIKQILDDLLEHNLLKDLSLERVVNYAVEFMKIVGMPKIYTDKIAELQLQEYRTKLPCDFIEMIGVRDTCGNAYRETTDTFHLKQDGRKQLDLTYKIQDDILYSNIKEGPIEISYRAIEVDCEGFPLIPDGSFALALKYYIKKQRFTMLFEEGKITRDAFANAQQEYAWYVGAAQTDAVRPTYDEIQTITNMWNTLIVRATDHDKQFRNEGTREYIRVQ